MGGSEHDDNYPPSHCCTEASGLPLAHLQLPGSVSPSNKSDDCILQALALPPGDYDVHTNVLPEPILLALEGIVQQREADTGEVERHQLLFGRGEYTPEAESVLDDVGSYT